MVTTRLEMLSKAYEREETRPSIKKEQIVCINEQKPLKSIMRAMVREMDPSFKERNSDVNQRGIIITKEVISEYKANSRSFIFLSLRIVFVRTLDRQNNPVDSKDPINPI